MNAYRDEVMVLVVMTLAFAIAALVVAILQQ